MALVDLLDKIQSFDYNQVGKPQSYKANPQDFNNVTGQQSFDRPIREPLPIQEQLLGYGLRNGSVFLQGENRGFNFFDDSFAQGFEVNKVDKETDFVFIDGNQSSFIPSANDSVWPGPVNYFDKDEEHPFVNGFILNKGISGNGPGTSDFKFLYDDLGTYTVKPELRDFGGNVYKWSAWDTPSGVNFFFGENRVDDVATGFTPNVEGTQFVDLEDNISNYVPKIKNTDYSWTDKDTPYLSNFFDDTQVPGFSQGMQTSTLFHVPAVSSKVIANSIEGGQYNSNSYLWSTDYFDYLNNLEFLDIANVGSLTDPIQFQSRLAIPATSLYGEIDYRRQAGRIENMTIDDSNFVTTNDEGDATEVNFVRDQAVNISRDSEGTNLNIPAGTRKSMQYPNSYTGKQITQEGLILEGGLDGIDEEVLVKPNRLKEFADDYFKDENKSMFIAVNDDGKAIGANKTQFKFLSPKDQGIKGADTYTNYIQEMSPGKNEPFIVRKIDDHWGTGADGNFLGEFVGGFVRTTGSPNDSIMGRLGRELADVQRKGKWLLSTDGIAFGLGQLFLQAQNRTIETRFWNPLSLASNSFLNIKRHVGGLTYVEAMTDPIAALKEKLPSFLQRFLKKDDDDGQVAPGGRVQFQAKWRAGQDTPEAIAFKKQGVPDPAGAAADAAKKGKDALLSEFSIIRSNPNHFFRLKFPFDPYGGPEGSDENAKALQNRLLSGVSSTTTHTFSEKKLERKGLEQETVPGPGGRHQNRKDYRYLTYGQIKTVADDKDQEYGSQIKRAVITQNDDAYVGNSVMKKDPFAPFKTEEMGSETALQQNDHIIYGEAMKNADAEGIIGDDINASSYGNSYIQYDFDWVDLAFETPQTLKSKSNSRVMQFRASINSLNESITPEYSEQRYLGRPDKYYTYAGVDRDINLDFTLYPKTAQEFPFLAEKLNYLVGLCYPEYNTSGFMIAPFVKMSLGDMFLLQPGYISSLQVNVQENTTWELDYFKFPKHITCALTFRYIGKYLPHKFGKHYELDWLRTDLGPTGGGTEENAGSTLTLNNPDRVVVNRSQGSTFDKGLLDSMQKKIGILGEAAKEETGAQQ